MKKRYIQDHIRSDSWYSELDPSEKLLWLHLLTNEKVWICGIYEIPLKKMAYETGLDKDMVIILLDRFEKDRKCFYRKWFILVCNFFKNLKVSSKEDNVRKWVERELKELWNHLEHFNEAIIVDTLKTLTRPLQVPYKELGILYLTSLRLNLDLTSLHLPDTDKSVWSDQEKKEESEFLEKEEIEEEKSSAKKEEGELAEYWRSDVNEIIKIMKQSCNDVWLQYMPWHKERAFAKHMLSKKLAKEIEKYNCPLEEFIRKVITASKQPYMKKVNSPKDFYDNRWYIVNASNQKTDSIKTISVI